jgi:hypothetical protein
MIHLISFCRTDASLSSASSFIETYQSQVDVCILFQSEELLLKYPEFKYSISPMPEYSPVEGWQHHFGKWKPFILFKYLSEMKENDVLVYYDNDVKSNVREDLLMLIDRDLIAGTDSDLLNKECIKPDVFTKIGDYRNTNTLNTQRIFIRKTKKTEQFIYDWLLLCDTSMLLPSVGKHTYEQALFNVLYYKYVDQMVFPSPKRYFKYNVSTPNFFKSFPDMPAISVKPPARRMLPAHKSSRPQMLYLKPSGI